MNLCEMCDERRAVVTVELKPMVLVSLCRICATASGVSVDAAPTVVLVTPDV